MRVLLKDGIIVLAAETGNESREIEAWKSAHADHVLHVRADPAGTGQAIELHDLGGRAEACREPINVVSSSTDPTARMVGNLAAAPFELDGQHYRSVESFWQGLKFPSEEDRRRLAGLEGPRARDEGARQGYGATITYAGEEIAVGTWRHWALMERACQAKFEQNEAARAALVATGTRPLIHVVRPDSKAIPGAIMAEIWMRIRDRLRVGSAGKAGSDG